jgi:hypothetical protein
MNILVLNHIKNCQYCGKAVVPWKNTTNQKTPPNARTIDHRIPRSRGGKNNPHNYAIACYVCNTEKNTLTDGEWLAVLNYRSGVTKFPDFPPLPVIPKQFDCSLWKHMKWTVAPYVNNFRFAVAAIAAFALLHIKKIFPT